MEFTTLGCCFWTSFASAFSKSDCMFKLDVLEVITIHEQLCAGSEGLWVVHDTPGDVIGGHLFLPERNSQKM